MSMRDLYQQVILDHARAPHGRGLREPDVESRSGESHQVNPVCGDEVTLRLVVDQQNGEDRIAALSWEGQGCSISQASLSVMTELVTGRTLAEADQIAGLFRDLMDSRGKGLTESETDQLGDAAAFVGVSVFPARIKCALLGWAALRDSSLKAVFAPERTS